MKPKFKVGAARVSIMPPLDQARRLGPKGLATDIIENSAPGQPYLTTARTKRPLFFWI